MDFTNKVVLVSGASVGIGEATAIMYARRGAKLVLVGRNEKKLRVVAERCAAKRGVLPLVIVADLATDEGCERTAREALQHCGRLDVLVNNAGVGARTDFATADMETFDHVFNLNVRGVYNLTRLLVPALVGAQGNVVNVSSIAGSEVYLGSLPYNMTKAAIDHFTRIVALELAPKGVRVNAVSPGLTVSKFAQRMTGTSDSEYEKFLKNFEELIPLGKVCQAEHVAKVIVHLSSADSELVTGAVVPVDGGLRFVANSVGDIKRRIQ